MEDLFNELSIFPLRVPGILSALICGFVVGFERQWSGKPAGIRTSILICMGAYVYTTIAYAYMEQGDPLRIIGQVITGVGFLGAGVIMAKDGLVEGVTSASVIWILAAIGCVIGFEKYGAAIAVTLLTIFVLTGIGLLERVFKKLTRGLHKKKDLDADY